MGQEKGLLTGQTYEYRDGSLHYVQPLPCSIPTLASKTVQDSSRNQITKSAGDERARIKDSHTEGQFFLGVPLG